MFYGLCSTYIQEYALVFQDSSLSVMLLQHRRRADMLFGTACGTIKSRGESVEDLREPYDDWQTIS